MERLLDSKIEERASEGDRVWFEAHSGRKFRIRPLIPGELAAKHSNYILVIQFRPGARLRKPVKIYGGMPDDNDEELLRLSNILIAGEPAIVQDGRVHSLASFPIAEREI
jgi:hypothetical protein